MSHTGCGGPASCVVCALAAQQKTELASREAHQNGGPASAGHPQGSTPQGANGEGGISPRCSTCGTPIDYHPGALPRPCLARVRFGWCHLPEGHVGDHHALGANEAPAPSPATKGRRTP